MRDPKKPLYLFFFNTDFYEMPIPSAEKKKENLRVTSPRLRGFEATAAQLARG